MATRFRILAVDDHEEILELIRITLEPDYDIVTLSQPADLYEILDLLEPDLLILDVMMPKITGFQLTEILRKNPATRELPIILLSAKSAPSEVKHGYRLGATLYLTKPFAPDRLVKNVATQFQVSPPSIKAKTQSIEEIAGQMELKPAYLKGHLAMGSNIHRKQSAIDPRKMMQSRLRASLAARQPKP